MRPRSNNIFHVNASSSKPLDVPTSKFAGKYITCYRGHWAKSYVTFDPRSMSILYYLVNASSRNLNVATWKYFM